MSKYTVLVVDDNALLRMGLTHSIESEGGFKILAEAANAEEAIELYKKFRPDVVTMDYQMPGMDGATCTKEIIAFDPEAKIILLTVKETVEDIWNAVQAGCKGYLTKRAGEVEEVLSALHEVANGYTYFPAQIAEKIKERAAVEDLTPRELEVLVGLSEGLSNKEIMDKLHLSEGTVKLHLTNLRNKLGAADRTQAVVEGVKRGLIEING
jgi:DNA-binding NarL/FixJ family response regulator